VPGGAAEKARKGPGVQLRSGELPVRRGREALSALKRALPRSVADYAQMIANLTVAISAVIAVGQYVESRRDARIARTLEMLERFEGETYAAPRQFATVALEDIRGQLHASLSPSELAALPAGQEAELASRLARIRVYGPAERGALPPELAQITGFFNTLQTCIEQRVCDGKTAHGLFDVYASSFWENYGAVIDHERRRARPSFAQGLETFVGEARATR